MEENKSFEQIVSIRIFKSQLKEVDKVCAKYPALFDNRSHFFRASANYFLKHIRSAEFKVSYIE